MLLSEAAGRVLAGPIVATEDLWPFARAAMDGIAVRAADVVGATMDRPVRLRIVEAIYAGEAPQVGLSIGTAARVATGAPIPSGADAVVPQELLRLEDDHVLVSHPAPSGMHIFPAGEDVRAGERVLESGTGLRGGHLALLAALGHGRVPVIRRATVAILTCGDELIEPAGKLRPGLVRESNSYALAAEVQALGATPQLLGNARDAEHELDERIRAGLQADVLITCGGLSVGERDFVRPALRRAGVTFEFEGVAMKPGAPAAFGRAGDRPVFALPGTPGACRVAFEVLVAPALRALMGHQEVIRPLVAARLSAPLRVRPGRRRYLWGQAVLGADGILVTPQAGQSTATLRSASDANALIVIDPDDADLSAGSRVPVLFLASESLPVVPARRAAVLGVVGARGAGKTTLIERLIPALACRGVAVAVVKHHAHQRPLDLDQDGTDTERAAAAGAVRTVLAGRGGITCRQRSEDEPPLEVVLAHAGDADLVLVEGYGQSDLPKILVQRAGVEFDRMAPVGPIVAIVGDVQGESGHPHFAWQAVDPLAEFIVRRLVRP